MNELSKCLNRILSKANLLKNNCQHSKDLPLFAFIRVGHFLVDYLYWRWKKRKCLKILTMKVQLDFWKRLSFRNLLTFCDKCGSLSVASPTRRQYQIFTHGSHYLPPFFLALINYGDILCKSIFRGLQIAFKGFGQKLVEKKFWSAWQYKLKEIRSLNTRHIKTF